MLRIAYDPALVPQGGAQVVSECASPLSGRMTAEPAGRKFHEKCLKVRGLYVEPVPKPDKAELARLASSTALDDEDEDAQENDPDYDGPKDPIKIGAKEFADHYDIMGLGRERYKATADQIKVNYKRLSLQMHPDKCGVAQATEDEKEAIEARFKALHTASEVLSDSKRRREYDSVDADPTDLPMDFVSEDFFEAVIPAFEDLVMFFDGKQDAGKFIEADPDAPFENVRKMYEFWAKFKSWREFPAKDEHDLESADDRGHKRHLEGENKKKRMAEKKKDTIIIKAFVERAELFDPRVLKKKQEEKDAREARRTAKGSGKKEAEEAAKLEAETAAAAAAAAAEADKAGKVSAKKELEKQKKALRKEKARLRDIGKNAEGWVGHPGEDDVEELINALELVSIQTLADSLTAADGAEPVDPGVVVEGLLQALAGLTSAKSEERKAAAEEAVARQAACKGEKVSAPWSDDAEVKLLDKACNQKFPMGTKDRWERVSEFMGENGPTPRTAKAVMMRYKAGF